MLYTSWYGGLAELMIVLPASSGLALAYLYPVGRLVVRVGLGKLPHDLDAADRAGAGLLGRGAAAGSFQQHGVFTHCGFNRRRADQRPRIN